MKTRLAQTLAALGTAFAVVCARWAWVLAFDPPLYQGKLDWSAPALAGLVAVAAIAWATWLLNVYPRDRGQEIDAWPERFPLYKVDRNYTILCCTLGGIAALLFISESTNPASWSLTGPPLLFAQSQIGGWSPGPYRELFTSFAFVLYYHILAMPGFSLLARTEPERSERRTVLLTAQWAFIAVHFLLLALFAWLMQH